MVSEEATLQIHGKRMQRAVGEISYRHNTMNGSFFANPDVSTLKGQFAPRCLDLIQKTSMNSQVVHVEPFGENAEEIYFLAFWDRPFGVVCSVRTNDSNTSWTNHCRDSRDLGNVVLDARRSREYISWHFAHC